MIKQCYVSGCFTVFSYQQSAVIFCINVLLLLFFLFPLSAAANMTNALSAKSGPLTDQSSSATFSGQAKGLEIDVEARQKAVVQEGLIVGLLLGNGGLGDQSFNDMTYAGLIRIRQQYNLKLIIEDSEKNDAAFEAAMQRLIDDGAHIIVANDFYLKDLVAKYAPENPDRYFILQDAILTGLPNVVCLSYSVEEGSFLVGALSGLLTTTNRVGFIGGVDIPVMHVFRKGFRDGVLFSNPAVDIMEVFVSKAPDYSGFRSPAAGYDIAMSAYEDGVDIIYAAAGLTGNGVIQAARKSGTFAIGVDSDQDHLAKGSVLTSMMKRLDIATFNEVVRIIEGKFIPGVKKYGLKDCGVGLTPMKYSRQFIPDAVISELSHIEARIIDGSINVANFMDTVESGAEGSSQ